jgi:hypothetical protein
MRRIFSTALLMVATAAPLQAQGALSLQGFGFPAGQLSTRAAATAGVLGEGDPGSPINPASLPNAGRSLFAFQVDPEFRQVVVNGRPINTKTARFPVIMVGTRAGTHGFIGVSFSTLLDRTWDAEYQDTVSVGGGRVGSTVTARVRGAINEVRVAYAWQFSEKLQAGVAFHAFSGANRIFLARRFSDSLTFGALSENITLAYGGSAVSAGLVAVPMPHVALAASLRMGGTMHTRLGDTVATSGSAPSRYGASLTYDGIPGTQLALRVNREQWTRMRSLGSSTLDVRDVTELSAGAEIAGPKFQGLPVMVRLGARTRGLPFGWNGAAVAERTLAIGSGMTVGRGWASLDVSLQRSQRTAAGLSEKATTLSVGLTVRP